MKPIKDIRVLLVNLAETRAKKKSAKSALADYYRAVPKKKAHKFGSCENQYGTICKICSGSAELHAAFRAASYEARNVLQAAIWAGKRLRSVKP